MNLRNLEIFRAVMQSQTTTGASKFLKISQPAVSSAIKQLEEQIGFALFHRFGNRISPTEEAKILYIESEPLFLMSKTLNRTVIDIKEQQLGTLKIVSTPQIGHSFLPAAINKLLKDKPKIKVSLDVRRSYHVVEAIQNGAADLGFAIALEKELSQTLRLEPIAAVDLVCLVHKNNPLSKRIELHPIDLSGQALIGLEMSTKLGPLISDVFSDAGIPYRTTVDVRYSQTACMLADEGIGICIVDYFSALTMKHISNNIKIIPFKPQTKVVASVIMAKDKSLSNISNTFLNITKDIIKQKLA